MVNEPGQGGRSWLATTWVKRQPSVKRQWDATRLELDRIEIQYGFSAFVANQSAVVNERLA